MKMMVDLDAVRVIDGEAARRKGVCATNMDRFDFSSRRDKFEMFCVGRHKRAGRDSAVNMVVEDVMTLVWEGVMHA